MDRFSTSMNPYRTIEMAEEGWPQICSMIFAKSRTYAAQREYRFAVLSMRADVDDVVDLPVSGMMRDCLESVRAPLIGSGVQVAITKDTSETPGKRETSRSYSYRRRRVKRESGNWGDEEGKRREKEEIVEETVTSPEEVPEPFPSEQQRARCDHLPTKWAVNTGSSTRRIGTKKQCGGV